MSFISQLLRKTGNWPQKVIGSGLHHSLARWSPAHLFMEKNAGVDENYDTPQPTPIAENIGGQLIADPGGMYQQPSGPMLQQSPGSMFSRPGGYPPPMQQTAPPMMAGNPFKRYAQLARFSDYPSTLGAPTNPPPRQSGANLNSAALSAALRGPYG